jgi:hypothetical protein
VLPRTNLQKDKQFEYKLQKMKTAITLFLALIGCATYPIYGVKIKSNFPTGSGGFARGFTVSNQDASSDFIMLGVNGTYNNGVSTMNYGFIGQSFTNVFMSFRPDGNIGIGITDPNEKLAVKGKIRAQEIKVEATNWPDYVFAKDYRLPSLRETEQHIKDKGHLPGIPSAEEVKANGVDLGEMNAKLLQKIEELTLHLIKLEKNNDKQQVIIEQQQTDIKLLKSKLK